MGEPGVANVGVGLKNAGYILKALLDPTTPAPQFDTAKENFEWVSGRLEILFPAT